MKLSKAILAIPFLIFLACGEAGIQVDVSKSLGYDFGIDVAGIDENGNATSTNPVDLGDELDSYDLSSATINGITYRISGLPDNFSSTFSLDLEVPTNGIGTFVSTPENSILENSSSDIVMYNSSVSSTLVDITAINSLEGIIQNGDIFTMVADGQFNNVQEDFIITFNFDITGKVRD